MEQIQSNNINRASVESRPNSGFSSTEPVAPNQQIRPQLTRTDSKSAFPTQSLQQRAGAPQQQQRPQFQPGGPVNNPPFLPRSGPTGPPNQRGPIPGGVPGSPQIRPQPPQIRSAGPQPHSQSPQSPRPLNSPSGPPPQRAPIPNNLQFGPRQPPQLGSATTPDSTRPQGNLNYNGIQRPASSPANAQITKQPSQTSLKSSDSVNSSPYKPINLDNQNISNDTQKINKIEDLNDMPGTIKGRSYSIAAAPGMPIPFKMDDDRRKSISSISGKYEDLTGRSSGLDLIQEVKNSTDNIRSSRESIKSEVSNEGTKDNKDRPESRMSGSKMTESFMGSLSNLSVKKVDDDDDVVLQNNTLSIKPEESKNKTELFDRSPSLTRSDESPEPKNVSQTSISSNKSQSVTPEPQRPKTPKTPSKQEPQPSDIKRVETPTKITPKSPMVDKKPPTITTPPLISNTNTPTEVKSATTLNDIKQSTPRKTHSAQKPRPKDGDNDSGVDESTQGNDINGSPSSPTKKMPSKLPTKEKSSSSLKQSLSRSSSKSATAKTPENPLPNEKKKVPMNKVQVGGAPSPNIKAVKSKIGSLDNTTYKPGGGKVKIENRKLDFNKVTPKIAAKNEAYTPSGGAKKITTTKLEWNAKSKIGSLQNASYKPGGGDKKIETVKLDFKEKAKPKVASTVNITHKPGGGDVKIENQKLEFKAQSKVGSMDNVKHKPGGGEVKIFDDKEYLKQVSGQSPLPNSHDQSRQEDYLSLHEWSEAERSLTRSRSARALRTPRTPRAQSPQKRSEELRLRNPDKERRMSMRPATARESKRSACSRRPSLSQRPAFTVY